MSKFFVHQRIKKVRGVQCLGLEGTVVAIGPNGVYDITIVSHESRIWTDGIWECWVVAGKPYGAHQMHWEPAIGPDDLTIEQDKRIEEIA